MDMDSAIVHCLRRTKGVGHPVKGGLVNVLVDAPLEDLRRGSRNAGISGANPASPLALS